MKIEVNDKVVETLISLGHDPKQAEEMRKFENTTQKILDTWRDADGTEYVTVDIFCDIPRSCCKALVTFS